MSWSEEALFAKAKLYMQNAAEQNTSSPLFPFWASLSLELLCRAALAKVSPTLLAEANDVDNLLYALGQNIGKSPKSIVMSEVLKRCVKVIPKFDQRMAEGALKLSEARNGELHGGEAAFSAFVSGDWQVNHYALARVVLEHLGRSMEDYLGNGLAARAAAMLDAQSAETEKTVKQRISNAAKWFAQLTSEDQEEKRNHGAARIAEALPRARRSKECQCPACKSKAIISGQISDRGVPRLGEDSISIEARILPTEFMCFSCNLRLRGYGEMSVAGLGQMYSIVEDEDPIEYFQIDPMEYVDPSDFFDRYGYQDE